MVPGHAFQTSDRGALARFRRLRMLVHKAVASFKSIVYVLFVLVFWHILGALLGMQVHSDPRAVLSISGGVFW